MSWGGREAEASFPMWARLFEADPELLSGLDQQVARHLARSVTAQVVNLSAGTLVPRELRESPVVATMILTGALAGTAEVAGRRSVDLLGRGDVLTTGVATERQRWIALDATRLAILDDDLFHAIQRFPSVVSALLRRASQRSESLFERLAIASMPHLEDRLLALLDHLAVRWGEPEPGATCIPLRLSHGMLAEMACAQRPSISAAAKALERRGLVQRGPRGSWLLVDGPRESRSEARARFRKAAVVNGLTMRAEMSSAG